ncbi:MAG: exodeoxyribonuclease VII small subunit [Erysipelotrichaceae bacterium]|nr:exodeoxyribonuclease VII small subunit [Erysipelotrichaceae bacterium]
MADNNFNKQYKRLEEIVDLLEKNEVNLDEALKLYQEGLKISKKLEKDLKDISDKLEGELDEQ